MPFLDLSLAAGWLWHSKETPGHASNRRPTTGSQQALEPEREVPTPAKSSMQRRHRCREIAKND